jgi:hypothetical protein
VIPFSHSGKLGTHDPKHIHFLVNTHECGLSSFSATTPFLCRDGFFTSAQALLPVFHVDVCLSFPEFYSLSLGILPITTPFSPCSGPEYSHWAIPLCGLPSDHTQEPTSCARLALCRDRLRNPALCHLGIPTVHRDLALSQLIDLGLNSSEKKRKRKEQRKNQVPIILAKKIRLFVNHI